MGPWSTADQPISSLSPEARAGAPVCSLRGPPSDFVCSSPGFLVHVCFTPAATERALAPRPSSSNPPNNPVGGRYSALFIAKEIEARSK